MKRCLNGSLPDRDAHLPLLLPGLRISHNMDGGFRLDYLRSLLLDHFEFSPFLLSSFYRIIEVFDDLLINVLVFKVLVKQFFKFPATLVGQEEPVLVQSEWDFLEELASKIQPTGLVTSCYPQIL